LEGGKQKKKYPCIFQDPSPLPKTADIRSTDWKNRNPNRGCFDTEALLLWYASFLQQFGYRSREQGHQEKHQNILILK